MIRNELALLLHQLLNSGIMSPHLIFGDTLTRITIADDDSMLPLLSAAAPLLKTLSSTFFEEILTQVKESTTHLVNTSRIVSTDHGVRNHASTILESDLFLSLIHI